MPAHCATPGNLQLHRSDMSAAAAEAQQQKQIVGQSLKRNEISY